MLAENGVALVFLPHLKGSFLQGATFMDGNKIVVGRLQNEGCIEYNMLNELKEHYVITV